MYILYGMRGEAFVVFYKALFGVSQSFTRKVSEKNDPGTFLGSNPLLSLEH